MFDQLFTRQTAISRHQAAPCSEERERYLRHLSSQHYALTSLRRTAHNLLAIVLQTDLAGRRQVTGEVIRRATLRRTATAWMAFLGKLVADPEPVTRESVVVKQFETFLRDERGLAVSTVEHYCWHARELMEHLTRSGH